MNQQTTERLYHLLPAIYRQRDAAQGEPLRALLAVMETELQAMEADIEGLYENWFIETCEEWVVPYIADLLGISNLGDQESTRLSHRAYVANTIAYRRRKGVTAILESVTLDVTGWRSRVVEMFDTVSVTQSINHVRSDKGRTMDIRNKAALEQLNLPFDIASYTADVRRINSPYAIRGKANVLNVGLFIWRLQSYPIHCGQAGSAQAECYTFHPLGRDMPLFNRPQTKTDIAQRTDVVHLPVPITFEAFAADLQEYSTQNAGKSADQGSLNTAFYGPDRSFHIILDNLPLLPSQIVSRRLEPWPDTRPEAGAVWVDVERGRLVVPTSRDGQSSSGVEVSYGYGFSGDLGGGPYDRHQTLADSTIQGIWFQPIKGGGGLQSALEDWQTSAEPRGVLRIQDNGIYTSGNSHTPSITIPLPSTSQLTLEAADGVRPALQASDVTVAAPDTGATLTLNGLLLEGTLILHGKLTLTLTHCTVLGGVKAAQGAKVQLIITSSIVGPIRLPDQQATLTITDSIIDSRPDAATLAEKAEVFAIAADSTNAPGPLTTLERTTVFGSVNVGELALASNVIFTSPMTVYRHHAGSFRFSYVPTQSTTPGRYRCQPDLALENANHDEAQSLRLHLTPRFTSVAYGEPGYAQLSQQCPDAIATGADDGSEMGAFHLLHQPQRRAYLKLNLEEYVPSGLDVGVFYIS
jgi:hypothetical protein